LLKKIKKFVSLDNSLEDKVGCKGYRLFFLGEHECDVEITEVKQINYNDVKKRLLASPGNSVFITMIPEGN
jgi:hypothetical protein